MSVSLTKSAADRNRGPIIPFRNNFTSCDTSDRFLLCLLQERGNRALHVAAQSGQSMQVELLVVYGADPGSVDNTGKTPADYAG